MKLQNHMTANSVTWWKIGIVWYGSVVQYDYNDPCLSVKPMSMIRPMNFRRSSSSASFHGSIFEVEAESGGLALRCWSALRLASTTTFPKSSRSNIRRKYSRGLSTSVGLQAEGPCRPRKAFDAGCLPAGPQTPVSLIGASSSESLAESNRLGSSSNDSSSDDSSTLNSKSLRSESSFITSIASVAAESFIIAVSLYPTYNFTLHCQNHKVALVLFVRIVYTNMPFQILLLNQQFSRSANMWFRVACLRKNFVPATNMKSLHHTERNFMANYIFRLQLQDF